MSLHSSWTGRSSTIACLVLRVQHLKQMGFLVGENGVAHCFSLGWLDGGFWSEIVVFLNVTLPFCVTANVRPNQHIWWPLLQIRLSSVHCNEYSPHAWLLENVPGFQRTMELLVHSPYVCYEDPFIILLVICFCSFVIAYYYQTKFSGPILPLDTFTRRIVSHRAKVSMFLRGCFAWLVKCTTCFGLSGLWTSVTPWFLVYISLIAV